jgi:hypothetical protein
MNPLPDEGARESERLFLSVRSTVSGRNAILEDDGFTVLLYLSGAADTKPEADCFVYSVVPPTKELVAPHGDGGPPILLQCFASEVAQQVDIPANAHRLQFSPDGHSVAVFIRDQPWAFIACGERRGYSKCISTAGPFGHPWGQRLFDDLFPVNRHA